MKPILLEEDWVEIYYALEAKRHVILDDENWRAHIDRILDTIGPDGRAMYPKKGE
jgi:hypothetical protein